MIKSALYCHEDQYLAILVYNKFVGSHLSHWKRCGFFPMKGLKHTILVGNNWSFIGPPVTVRWEDE